MYRCLMVLICLVPYFTMVHLKNEDLINDDEPPQLILFIFGGLAVGGLLRAFIRFFNFPIPFRVLIIFVGMLMGWLISYISGLEKYMTLLVLKPSFLLMAFLPVIVFKTAFCIDAHTFVRSWSQLFFLGVPGFFLSACFTGSIMMVILGHGHLTFTVGLLFGVLCSPIYPVEIVEMLKEIGEAKHLAILLEGEGMIGDSMTMISFEIILQIIDGKLQNPLSVFGLVVEFVCGGILWGLVAGKTLTCIMGALYNDVTSMLLSSLAAAYLTYYIGAEIFSVSGIIAVMILGIMASMEKTSLSVDVEKYLLYFWEMLAYIANTIIFLLAGVLIIDRIFKDTSVKQYTLVIVTYVVAGVARFLAYGIMAPIVSRIGYGLTFKKMALAVWGGIRGPLPFCLALSVDNHAGIYPLGPELLTHIAGLVTLTLLVNATSMPVLLKLLGVSEISMARKVNMNNCLRHLNNRRDRTMAMLKMDRFLADANWPIVSTGTLLKHPYKIKLNDSDDEDDNYLGYRTTTCPDCLKEVLNKPTAKEMLEMTREARTRILKAKKISYARQYENGMLSKDAIRVLTQAVEIAMDTPEALIELDGLHKYFKRQGFIHYTRRRLLAVFFKKSENTIKPPRKYYRRMCYHIIMHPAFECFIYFAIVLNVIPIWLELDMLPNSKSSTLNSGIKISNTIFFVIYFVEFILKIYGYSWIYICKHGFKTYFKSYWNIFDFLILCACAVDLVMDYIDWFSPDFNKLEHKASRVTLATKLVRVIRLVRLLRLCKAWYPKLIKYCDSRIDKHLAFAYDVGKGFVTGEEEVSSMLTQMIDNKQIREDCRLRMETDRLAITKELGMVQKDRPWIAITVKTRQAIRSTLNSTADSILELKVSGWVDDVEYTMLMESLEERMKYVRTKVTSVQPSPPKVMFKEVPWMADNEQIADFLYENVVTKVFDQGDVVCVDGEMSDGVYVIVTGLFKLSYTPKKEVIDNLLEYGSLPIIDYINSPRFHENVEDYIVSGNCVGELSAITGRPYSCNITADTASQAYILTHDVIKQAFQRSPDPINGLEAKMWKSLSIRLATSLLMDTPAYQSSTREKIRFLLERSFVPNLSNYKVFAVNDMIEDILLIEGVVFDYNTRDYYSAPCYIPRTVQKIVMPKSSHMDFETTIETKLLIIPAKEIDEFDIMEKGEEISEMISTASEKCLQHVIQNRAYRLKRKRKRQTTFSMGGRRVKYGDSYTSTAQSLVRSRSTATADTLGSTEAELQDTNLNERYSTTLESYAINEKENRDRRMSRSPIGPTIERRTSARGASSVNPHRLVKDVFQTDDHRFNKVVEPPPRPGGEKDPNSKLDAVPEEEKIVISDGKPPNTPNESERLKDTSVIERKHNLNSSSKKEKQDESSTATKSLNNKDNLMPPPRETTTLDISPTQRRLNSLKKDRTASGNSEQVEVEQRSQILTDIKEKQKIDGSEGKRSNTRSSAKSDVKVGSEKTEPPGYNNPSQIESHDAKGADTAGSADSDVKRDNNKTKLPRPKSPKSESSSKRSEDEDGTQRKLLGHDTRGEQTITRKTKSSDSKETDDQDSEASLPKPFSIESSLTQLRRKSIPKHEENTKIEKTEMESLISKEKNLFNKVVEPPRRPGGEKDPNSKLDAVPEKEKKANSDGKLPKTPKESERLKDTSVIERKENLNSPTIKEKQDESSTATKSLNNKDNLMPPPRETTTSNISPTQRRLNSLKKDRTVSENSEQVEVEQRSQIFTDIKEKEKIDGSEGKGSNARSSAKSDVKVGSEKTEPSGSNNPSRIETDDAKGANTPSSADSDVKKGNKKTEPPRSKSPKSESSSERAEDEDGTQRKLLGYDTRGEQTITIKKKSSGTKEIDDQDSEVSLPKRFSIESSLTQLRRKSIPKNKQNTEIGKTEMESLISEDKKSREENKEQRNTRNKDRNEKNDYSSENQNNSSGQ